MDRDVASRSHVLELVPPVDPRPRVDTASAFHRFNGGWLAVDFVNTVPGWLSGAESNDARDWRDRPAGERLVGYGDLLLWSRLQGMLDERAAALLAAAARRNPRRARAVVQRAHSLRAALYRLFRASVRGWELRPDDVRSLAAELARLRRRETLVAGPAGLMPVWASAAPEVEAVLWAPVRSAVALLTDPELVSRLGQCGGDLCGWVFLDVGRGRSRRWCDSRDCGNVAKARAFRERHRAAG